MKKVYLILFYIVLLLGAIGIIVGTGDTYTAKFDLSDHPNLNVEKVELEAETKGIIKVIDKRIKNDKLEVKLKAVSKGKTFVTLKDDTDMEALFLVYVHDHNVITYNGYFGDTTGVRTLPIVVFIVILTMLFNFIYLYRKSIKENIYRYQNVFYLGLIILFIAILVNQFHTAFLDKNYMGVSSVVTDTIGLYTMFSIVMLPIAFVTSILIIISSIVLIKREGFSVYKLLGFMLGAFICIATMIPDAMYRLLQGVAWIDIHNQKSIALMQ